MNNDRPRIKLSVAAQQFNAVKLNGFEAISNPYRFVIDLIDNADDLLGTPVSLQLYDRNISGIITQTHGTSVIFEPKLALAKLNKGARIMLNQSVPDVIKMILLACGYNEGQIKFNLQKTYKPKPYRMQLANETDFSLLQRLVSTAGIFYWFDYKNNNEIIHFSDQQHAGSINNIEINKISSTTDKIILQSSSAKPQPGFCMKLDANYLIRRIQHFSKQNVANFGQERGYYNVIQLCAMPLKIMAKKINTYGDNYQAHIASNNKYAQLNEHGQYFWQQRFDLTEYPNTSALPPTKMLAPYSGWHLPLQHGAEVLVNTLNGDPDQPIILGTIPNADKTSPTTATNKMQHILHTQGDNQLLMDDTKDKQNIKLHTYGKHNLLELNADKDNPAVNLTTDKGDMTWLAKQDINIQTQANITENVAARIYTAAANHQTQAKDIHYQAETDHNINTKTKLNLHSEKNIEQQQNNLNYHTNNTKLKANTILINTDTDITAQSLNLSGTTIELGNNSGGIKITPAGTIEIFGSGLNLAGGIVPGGKVNHIPSPTSPTTLTNPPQPLTAQKISDLNFDNDKQDKKDPLQDKFNDEYISKFNPHPQMFNSQNWFAHDQAAHKTQVQYTDKAIKFPQEIAHNDKLELQYIKTKSNSNDPTNQQHQNNTQVTDETKDQPNGYPSAEVKIVHQEMSLPSTEIIAPGTVYNVYTVTATNSFDANLKVSNKKSVNPTSFNKEGIKIFKKEAINETAKIYSEFKIKNPASIIGGQPTLTICNNQKEYTFSLTPTIITENEKQYTGTLSKDESINDGDWIINGEVAMSLTVTLSKNQQTGAKSKSLVYDLEHDVDKLKSMLISLGDGAVLTFKQNAPIIETIAIITVIVLLAPIGA